MVDAYISGNRIGQAVTFTDHFRCPGRALGRVCAYVKTPGIKLSNKMMFDLQSGPKN